MSLISKLVGLGLAAGAAVGIVKVAQKMEENRMNEVPPEGGVLDDLAKAAGQVAADVGTAVKATAEKAGVDTDELGAAIGGAGKAIVNAGKAVVTKIQEDVPDFANDVADAAEDVVEDVSEEMQDAVEDAGEAAGDALAKARAAMEDAFQNAAKPADENPFGDFPQ